MNTELADPLSCGTVFFCGSDAAASPAEAAKLLISAMLDSLSKDSNERQFTILDYAVPDQVLQTRANVVASKFVILSYAAQARPPD